MGQSSDSATPSPPPARTATLDLASARWLIGPLGHAAVARAAEIEDDLRAVAVLRAEGLARERAAAAVDAARAHARASGPLAAPGMVLTRAGLEQASHPAVAAWRAERFSDVEVAVDLCAGVGGDALALSARTAVVAVERDPATALLLRHNATVIAHTVLAVRGDALRPPVAPGLAVHLDPSRRAGGVRARRLAEYDPPPGAVLGSIDRAAGTATVLSPAVDLRDPDLPEGELEFVQVEGRLVEAVSWSGDLSRPDAAATATLLPSRRTRTRTGPPAAPRVGPLGRLLLEPAPALVRARLHDVLAGEVGAWRWDPARALLTGDDLPPDDGWVTAWRVEAVCAPRPRAIRAALRSRDDRPVSFALHGTSLDLAGLWRALGRPRRGPIGRRIHLVRTNDGVSALVTVPATGP